MTHPTDQPLEPNEFMGEAVINGNRYLNRRMIRVARITLDGATCTVPRSQLLDMLDENNAYTVEIGTMRRAEFDQLPEFAGW